MLFRSRWEKKKYNEFIDYWVVHEDIKERIHIYHDLNRWKEMYELGSIEVAISVMLRLWERVQDYERSILWKDRIRTLVEAEEHFKVFEAYRLMVRPVKHVT